MGEGAQGEAAGRLTKGYTGVLLSDGFSGYQALKKARRQQGLTFTAAYCLKLWEGLTAFLTDANVPLDNNAAERSLRGPVMGRNNYHGFRTLDGADIGMTYFSLIDSCKLMRLTPEFYLREMAHRACRGEPLETP